MALSPSNLVVFTDAKRGGRNYMEDIISTKIDADEIDNNQADMGSEMRFAFFAVFDGHGGAEAAKFAEEHLFDEIIHQKGFWKDDDTSVVEAIKDGFMSTHRLMWKALETWPKTQYGLPSTAGTTASIVLIRNGSMYVAHVGDSTVALGVKNEFKEDWIATSITTDHKPDLPSERKRIENNGGQVLTKAGVPRVVWQRPRILKGPVRRSTTIDNVPFLAVARSLGDLWSYNSKTDTFTVSPVPDVHVYKFDPKKHKCIILATDGVWNMVNCHEAMQTVRRSLADSKVEGQKSVKNVAACLVDLALEKWKLRNIRADNTSAVVIIFPDSEDNANVEQKGSSVDNLNQTNKLPGMTNSAAEHSLSALCNSLIKQKPSLAYNKSLFIDSSHSKSPPRGGASLLVKLDISRLKHRQKSVSDVLDISPEAQTASDSDIMKVVTCSTSCEEDGTNFDCNESLKPDQETSPGMEILSNVSSIPPKAASSSSGDFVMNWPVLPPKSEICNNANSDDSDTLNVQPESPIPSIPNSPKVSSLHSSKRKTPSPLTDAVRWKKHKHGKLVGSSQSFPRTRYHARREPICV